MQTRYLRFAELTSEFGIPFSREHLNRLITAGDFPAPVHLGTKTVRWEVADILAWSDRLRAERDARQLERRSAAYAAGCEDAAA